MQDQRAEAGGLSKQSQKAILRLLDDVPHRVFTRRDLGSIISNATQSGQLSVSVSATRFIDFLGSHGLTRVRFAAPENAPAAVTRYVWGPVSLFSLGLSLRAGAYLSHGTAVFLHGLTDQIPKTVYVNKEQSPKPPPTLPLSQEGLNRAFANAQRASTYVFGWEGNRFVLLSGKNTNRLEVSELAGPAGERLDVTKLERTLIDITVRPAYAGGVFEVAKAYRAAKDRISINTLVATLKQLGYLYPYHQAIGFYLERAGVDPAKLEKLKQLGLNFDFFLSHKMGPTSYSPEWRLRFPEGM
ncbi:MAG: hypothetical protein WCC48_11930 [Anaeromyxobacteraceae bacterium]